MVHWEGDAIPLGCSAQSGGDWAAHYRTSGDVMGDQGIHEEYQLVCSGTRRQTGDHNCNRCNGCCCSHDDGGDCANICLPCPAPPPTPPPTRPPTRRIGNGKPTVLIWTEPSSGGMDERQGWSSGTRAEQLFRMFRSGGIPGNSLSTRAGKCPSFPLFRHTYTVIGCNTCSHRHACART